MVRRSRICLAEIPRHVIQRVDNRLFPGQIAAATLTTVRDAANRGGAAPGNDHFRQQSSCSWVAVLFCIYRQIRNQPTRRNLG